MRRSPGLHALLMMLLSSTGNMNVCAATRTCKCFTPNKRISGRGHCPLMGRHMSVTASNPVDSLAVCSWDCSSQQRAMPSWCQCFRYMFVNGRGHYLLQKRRLTAVAPHITRNLLLATEVVWVNQIISHSRSTVGIDDGDTLKITSIDIFLSSHITLP